MLIYEYICAIPMDIPISPNHHQFAGRSRGTFFIEHSGGFVWVFIHSFLPFEIMDEVFFIY